MMRQRCKLSKLCWLSLLTLWLNSHSVWANPITTIDVRDGVTQKSLFEYQKTVLGSSEGRSSAKLIKLLVSADKGFDAGWLTVPKQRRFLRVNIHIYTFRGSTISAPIRVNLYELDARTIKYLNLEVSLR